MKEVNFLKSIIICTALFAVSATVSALVGKMIITDTTYFAVSAENHLSGVSEIVNRLKDVSEVTLFQLLILVLAGFSVLSLVTSSLVSAVRGVTFGYCAATASNGAVTAEGILPVGTCYAITSVVVIIFSAIAVSFSSMVREKGLEVCQVSKYIAAFFAFSGIAVLIDGARLLFV